MPFDILVKYLEETFFILDPDKSSLDLLSRDQAGHFKNFKWHYADYPGKPFGPNERQSKNMVFQLNGIRPERRANIGPAAVVTKKSYNSLKAYINSELRPVPDFPPGSGYTQPPHFVLNQFALSDFLLMRAAALREGVALIILSSGRSAAKALRNATRSGNSQAVAKFSVHMLGLGMDLKMSYKIGEKSGNYKEMTTKPMQNVVNMRSSPVHKWMFIRGAQYGWYPLQNEPWHWEYNPPGFQERFLSNLKAHNE